MERISGEINKAVLDDNWKPSKVKDLKISHLFYVGDVLLFGEASLSDLEKIMNVHNKIANESGL